LSVSSIISLSFTVLSGQCKGELKRPENTMLNRSFLMKFSMKLSFIRITAAAAILLLVSAIFLNALEPSNKTLYDYFNAIEKRTGGVLGVAAIDTTTGKTIDYHGEKRFAMCSTFKLLLVAAVLSRVDEKEDSLDRIISYQPSDLLDYAPITAKHIDKGGMKLSELCAAAIEYSDNTAANLLFKVIGGPGGLTAYIRSLGDSVTRFDRIEPFLNSNIQGDDRDTTTPKAMRDTILKLVIGNCLSPESRKQLEEWLIAFKTGSERLRAGIPSSWRVGNKTGTGLNGATNDVAVLWPPNRSPMIIAVYFTNAQVSAKECNAVIAEVGHIITTEFMH